MHLSCFAFLTCQGYGVVLHEASGSSRESLMEKGIVNRRYTKRKTLMKLHDRVLYLVLLVEKMVVVQLA
jgi:hypothetical protein